MANQEPPRVVIETEYEESEAGGQGSWWSTYTEEDYTRTGRQARSTVDGARRKATAFAEGILPGHGNAVVYGVLGFIAADFVLRDLSEFSLCKKPLPSF